MSNTYFQTLSLTGRHEQRERLFNDLVDVEPSRFFEVHVPLAPHAQPQATWGTCGLKSGANLDLHDASATEFSLQTHNAPPGEWLVAVSTQFPGLTFELFYGCFEEGCGGYMRAIDGQLLVEERRREDITGLFARRGRPGFFAPYWKDEGFRARLEGSTGAASASATSASDDNGSGLSKAELELGPPF